MPPPPSSFVSPLALRPASHRLPQSTCARAPQKWAATAAAERGASPSYDLAPGEIGVRFINTPSGKDVVAAALPGDPLLRVGDGVGVQIPRACQSGLCGSCTCDVVDPAADGGSQTVRACQTSVASPDGAMEMVIDVSRMREFKGKQRDPMARFDNLDTEYVAGAAPKKRGTWLREVECGECGAKGDVECLACDGHGVVEEGGTFECALCAGTGQVRCAECQGTGIRQVRR